MKWFKHLTGSLKDVMISDLISTFGGDGYLVFFGILDLMAEDFDIENPGEKSFSIHYLTKNLQVSRQKFVKILTFLQNFPKKKGKIFHVIEGDIIHLSCPRLKDLADEYTKKQIGSKSGVTPAHRSKKKDNIYNNKEKSIKRKPPSNDAGVCPADAKISFGSEFGNVKMKQPEYESLVQHYGKENVDNEIDELDVYINASKKSNQYKNHHAVIIQWLKRDGIGKIKQEDRAEIKQSEPWESIRARIVEADPKANAAFERNVIKPLADELSPQSHAAFIAPLCVQKLNGHYVIIAEPSIEGWVRDNYASYIAEKTKQPMEIVGYKP